MRTCKTCAQTKNLDCFYVIKGWRRLECRDCTVNRNRDYYYNSGRREKLIEYRKNNKELVLAREKKWRESNSDRCKGKILRQYWPGATWKEALSNFKALVEAQSNLCKICNQPETCLYNKQPGKVRDLCVDHCHKTGKVRGLLCDSCNVLLGRAKDSVEICLRAAKYLEEAHEALPRTA